MTEREKLIRDIIGLLDSVRQDWKDIHSLGLKQEEIVDIKKYIKRCVDEV